MHRVSSISYSVSINGKLGRLFKPSRGLRQRDPLSPFLFLICSEGLSSLLRMTTREGSIKGVRASRNEPQISHLLFANDCVFVWGSNRERCTRH